MAKQIDKQNIAQSLSEEFQISLKDALRFVENFSEVLIDYLKDKEDIQIDRLGVFSLLKDATGEKFKVNFESDGELQQRINKPFEQFEKVLLDDDVAFDGLEMVVEGASESKVDPKSLNNEDEVIKESVGEDSSETSQNEEDVPTEFRSTQVSRAILDMSLSGLRKQGNFDPQNANSETQSDETKKMDSAEEKSVQSSNVTEQISPVTDKKTENNTNKTNSNNIRNIHENKDFAMNKEEFNKKFPERNSQNYGPSSGAPRPRSGNSQRFWVIVIICVVIICCVVAYFVTSSSSFSSSGDSDMVVDSTAILDDSNVMDTIVSSTQTVVDQQQSVRETPKKVNKYATHRSFSGSSKPIAYVTMDNGLSLRQLALRYYGSKTFWVYIYQENKSKIANPNNIHVGTKLVIPSRFKYGIDRCNSRSVAKARAIEKRLYAQFCR